MSSVNKIKALYIYFFVSSAFVMAQSGADPCTACASLLAICARRRSCHCPGNTVLTICVHPTKAHCSNYTKRLFMKTDCQYASTPSAISLINTRNCYRMLHNTQRAYTRSILFLFLLNKQEVPPKMFMQSSFSWLSGPLRANVDACYLVQ